MLNLKKVLEDGKTSQADLARAANVSTATITQLVRHGIWPKTIPRGELTNKIHVFLESRGLPVAGALEDAIPETQPDAPEQKEDEIMLLRKQTLSQDAKKHFAIFRDPFAEVRSSDEVYLSPDIRYVREALLTTAKQGGFVAVVGESGSGKSTLRRDLLERLRGQPVIVIQPHVLAMEDNDTKGKTLKSTHIAEAIMSAVAPLERPKSSPEARFSQTAKALSDSSRAGYSHVLIIEEAHSLPIATLKHLKRFHELEDGFKRPLGIILIGQPELAQKLDERNPAVREVVQRCEMVTLNPLQENLKPFIQARFKAAGVDLDNVMNDDAIEALRGKLTNSGNQRPGREAFSVLYPLAVQNVITAAMNAAAEFGVPRVTAELIKGV